MRKQNTDNNILKLFSDRFKKEVLSLHYKEMMESLILFFELIDNQGFLDEIQKNLITNKNIIDKNNYIELALLFNKLLSNQNLSLDLLNEFFIDGITKKFSILNSDSQVKMLSAYAYYYAIHMRPNEKHKKISNEMNEKIAKLFIYAEKELTSCVSNLKIDDCMELLNAFFQTGHGSKEFFEEIEKHLGKNVESLSSDRIFTVLNTFVLSGKMRPKFVILLQKRIVDIKENFKIDELTKILRIYTSLQTNYDYIYKKCEKYFISMKEHLNNEDIANIIFAYSNPNFKSKYLILNDFENIIHNRIEKMVEEKAFEPMIEILYSYLLSKKGEKNFIEKLFNGIINTNHELDVSSNACFKLYYCFCELKTPISITSRFDHLLLTKLINFSQNELKSLNTFLKSLNYSNIEILDIIDSLIEIDDLNLTNLEKIDRKVKSVGRFVDIIPIYDKTFSINKHI